MAFLELSVFPAHAGVIPAYGSPWTILACLSRTCGGDPCAEGIAEFLKEVFPAHAGVIPLPHAMLVH